jgi:hypothetical protein
MPRGLARGPLLAGLALLVALAVWKVVPWLTQERTITASTPTVMPLGPAAQLGVPARQAVCLRGVVFDRHTQAAQIVVFHGRRPGPALSLTASAPGYAATGRAQGGYPDGSVVTIPFPAADRERADGTLCVRNDGTRPIGLAATGDARSKSDATTVTVAGRPAEPQPSFTLVERRPASVLGSAGTILERVAAFRPFGTWLLWPLAILTLLAAPVLVIVAVAAAARDDEIGERPSA